MKKLGKTPLSISNQGLGCMSMSEFYDAPITDEQATLLFLEAFDHGINFFDTADMYGNGHNEKLVGKAVATLIKDKGIERSDTVIATKCGIVRDENDPSKRGVDNSYDYIKKSCDSSLQRLGKAVKYIDLYYIHRIANEGAQLNEAMQAMAELLTEGKIKAVGLSEANTDMIKTANDALLKHTSGKHQLAAIQTEYSLMTRVVETNGVLNLCRELGIEFVAYSPLSRALLTGEIDNIDKLEAIDFRRNLPRFQAENIEMNQVILQTVKDLAAAKGVSTAQVALAWVLHQNVTPIPGTTKVKNLLSNIAADNIKFSASELQQLNSLRSAAGHRYSEAAMKSYGLGDEL